MELIHLLMLNRYLNVLKRNQKDFHLRLIQNVLILQQIDHVVTITKSNRNKSMNNQIDLTVPICFVSNRSSACSSSEKP